MTNSTLTAEQLERQKLDDTMEATARLAGIYRSNLPLFVEEYLGITLYLFQEILLFFMNTSNFFMFIASRGIGKTFLTALYCCCRCILYPGTQIVVACKTRGQGNEVLNKIKDILMPMSANLRSEINLKDTTINTSNAWMSFYNGSKIKVATASDNSRGLRSNIIVVDEFRLVSKNVVDSVLRKFLTTPRSPEYLKKPEYKHLREENKEMYLSSAWFKSHWSFEKFKTYAANLLDESKDYFVCGLPYQLAVEEGMFSERQMQEQMSEDDFSELSWSMEMECLFYGDGEGSFFTYESVNDARQLRTAIYPRDLNEALPQAKLRIPDLAPKERRILSVDVALMASTKQSNDAASIWINSALPTTSNRYVGNFIYAETHEGLLTSELALKVRRLYEMYHCSDIALDVKGVGIGVFDCLVREIYDPDYGVTYPPLNCCNNADYAARCTDVTAPKVIWAINGSPQFNSDMYIALREAIKSNRINFLVSEYEYDDTIVDTIKGINKLSMEERIMYKMPYIETTLFTMELINLEYEAKGNLVRVYEKSGARKDRVSSIGYNYWVQSQYEKKLKINSFGGDPLTMLRVKQPVIR